jgi:CheY-like chemotaxis protein/CheY-specific phosphatase CheX
MLPTVLVADESRGTRQLVTRQLRALGWQTLEASDGLETIERLGQRDADFAVIDVSLRQLSGTDVIAALRESNKYAELPVVAMGATDAATLTRLIALRLEDFFVKPFTSDFLRERLQRFKPRANARVRMTQTGAPASANGVAMVVDGDAQFRDFVSKVLASRYSVVDVPSGVAALRACAMHRPALVVSGTDIGLIGPALLADNLKRRPDLSRTSLVLVTPPDHVGPPANHSAFGAVLTRTFVIDDFERQLSRALGRSLVGGSPALAQLCQSVESGTQQVLGMMAGCDSHVVSREPSSLVRGLAAWTLISMSADRIAVRMVLRCEAGCARVIAAGLLGMSAAELTDEDGLAALGELVNVIGGRVKSSADAGQSVSLTLPMLVGEGQLMPAGDPEVCLTFEPVDGSFRLTVEMSVVEDDAGHGVQDRAA